MSKHHGEAILMESKIYPLSSHLTNGKVERLFDFIATSCKDFCARFKVRFKLLLELYRGKTPELWF